MTKKATKRPVMQLSHCSASAAIDTCKRFLLFKHAITFLLMEWLAFCFLGRNLWLYLGISFFQILDIKKWVWCVIEINKHRLYIQYVNSPSVINTYLNPIKCPYTELYTNFCALCRRFFKRVGFLCEILCICTWNQFTDNNLFISVWLMSPSVNDHMWPVLLHVYTI